MDAADSWFLRESCDFRERPEPLRQLYIDGTGTEVRMPEAAAVDWGDALAEHRRWLLRVVLVRVGERHAADEVLQEVALAAVKRPADPAPTNITAWLYRVAVRAALQHRRRLGRQRRLVQNLALRSGDGAAFESEDWLVADERRGLVRAALARLPARSAELLLLKYAENWSCRQIAERLGVGPAAIEMRLHRARKLLRDELAEGGLP